MMVTIDKEMFKDLSDSMEKENAQTAVPVINDVDDVADDKPEKKWTMGPIIVGGVVLAVVVAAMLIIAYVI